MRRKIVSNFKVGDRVVVNRKNKSSWAYGYAEALLYWENHRTVLSVIENEEVSLKVGNNNVSYWVSPEEIQHVNRPTIIINKNYERNT